MRRLLNKLPLPLRRIIGLTQLCIWVYCLWQWPQQTILCIIILEMLKGHWDEVLAVLVTTALAFMPGMGIAFFIGWLFEWDRVLTGIFGLFTSIYVMGLIIDEENRAPYIWLWRQCKKLFQKRHDHLVIS